MDVMVQPRARHYIIQYLESLGALQNLTLALIPSQQTQSPHLPILSPLNGFNAALNMTPDPHALVGRW